MTLRCAATGCRREAQRAHRDTDPLLARLCDSHRRAARERIRNGLGPSLAYWVAELCAPRPLCARCHQEPAGIVRQDTDPELAGYCGSCRANVRKYDLRARSNGTVRPVSINLKRVPKSLALSLAEVIDARREVEQYERPRVRQDCLTGCNAARPCPWVSCKYHLYLDVNGSGSLRLNHPGLEPWQLAESCALDAADRDGLTLEEVGVRANLTRERMRQIEQRACRRMRPAASALEEPVRPRPTPQAQPPAVQAPRAERPLDAAWLAHATTRAA